MIRRPSVILAALVGSITVLIAANSAPAQSVDAARPSATQLPGTPAPAASPVPDAPAADASPHPEPSAPEPSGAPEPMPRPTVSGIPGLRPGATLPFALSLPSAQPYATFMRGATRQTGVIDLVRKDDELYFDLRPENFDHTYIVLPSIERGVGSGAFAGRVYEPFPITFKRVGKRVLWVTPNTRYVAPKGSAAANSLAVSVADTVLLSTPIVAEDPNKEHTVVAPSVFLTDFEGIGGDLGRGAPTPSIPGLLMIVARPTYAVDATKSYYGPTKAFPRNDEISVNLAFNGPANAMPTVPDGRGIPITVHYSIVAPPEHDPRFVPRYADDRVGYFITARKSYGNDGAATPIERFVERWDLNGGPITFYLTNEIPSEYRETVRRAILVWNDAFARIGRPNAIVVKDPPSDPNWDPDDARYTTVRWITSDSPDFSAYSPHVSDPDTGQIIRAEVVIDGESLRSVKRGYTDRILPERRAPSAFAAPRGGLDAGQEAESAQECSMEEDSVAKAALGMQLLTANPRVSAAARERYAQQWLFATVMHEVGHTLGLRHNFMGSMAFSYAQLHDPAFTATHGTTGSVMDYTPANLAAPGERQAGYFPDRLGAYDYWAISYGYTTFPNVRGSSDEAIPLSRIAARSTERGLAYGTDEDAGASAIDPRIARFDLSADPLAYVDEQFRVDDDVARHLLERYPGDTRSFQDLRSALVTILNDQNAISALAAQYVGGIETSRAHRGEPRAPLPFVAISRAEQRRAFDLLDHWVLSSRAFRFSPDLLNAAAPTRFGLHWGSTNPRRADFPIREVIAEVQDDVIVRLFSPENIARIADQEYKMRHPGETMTLADLFSWTNAAIYDDVGRPSIDPAHRELQRRFADLQMQIVALPSSAVDQLDLPRETQELARYELMKLSSRLDAAIRAAKDEATRAHLVDLRARVAGVLRAQNVRQV
jgi:hypothetical protein